MAEKYEVVSRSSPRVYRDTETGQLFIDGKIGRILGNTSPQAGREIAPGSNDERKSVGINGQHQ